VWYDGHRRSTCHSYIQEKEEEEEEEEEEQQQPGP
jgi:hypothetical protein